MPSPLLSAPGIELDLEAFERIMAGDRLALMRIGARWLLQPGCPPPTPVLVADTGDSRRRFHPLPQPAATIQWVHADARLWWAGYAVPADLVLAVRTRWSLEGPAGARLILPEPDERSLLEIAEPQGYVVRNGRTYLLVTCGLVAAALIPITGAVVAHGDGTNPQHPTGVVVPDPTQLTGVAEWVGATTHVHDALRGPQASADVATPSAAAPTKTDTSGQTSADTSTQTTPASPADTTDTTPAPPTDTTPAPPTDTTPAPPTDTTPAPPTDTTPAPPTDTTPAPPTDTTPAPPTDTTPAPPATDTTPAPPAPPATTPAAPTETTPSPAAPRPEHHRTEHPAAATHVHLSPTAPHDSGGTAPTRHSSTAPVRHSSAAPAPSSVPVRSTPLISPSSALPAFGSLSGTGLGPASAVPDAMLGDLAVPPFLLPIYQAAGTEYDVPWQVLAAINQIETNFGRDLAVSSAGAQGWMQFMPATWRLYGVDANLDGRADPNNPVDAIFAAARYLHAAGASQDLGRAIFAYNHASWYVQEVLTAAQRFQSLPGGVLDSITGLTQGRFPILGGHVSYRSGFNAVSRQAVSAALRTNDPTATLRAPGGRAVVAAVDGRVVSMGQTSRGAFIVLEDAFGNRYTYGHLGSLVRQYAVPTGAATGTLPVGPSVGSGDAVALGDFGPAVGPGLPAQTKPAPAPAPPAVPDPGPVTDPEAPAGVPVLSGGDLSQAVAPSRTGGDLVLPAALARSSSTRPARLALGDPVARVASLRLGTGTARRAPRLPAGTAGVPVSGAIAFQGFGPPASTPVRAASRRRPLSRAAMRSALAQAARSIGVDPSALTLRDLQPGARVVAGTVLGHLAGSPTDRARATMILRVHTAGAGAPAIDPAPLLDGWRLQQRTTVLSATWWPDRAHPRRRPALGSVLLLDRDELSRAVLSDPRIHLSAAAAGDVRARRADRRVLGALEALADAGLQPSVGTLVSGYDRLPVDGGLSAHAAGTAVDISALRGQSLRGRQGPGSLGEQAVRRLLSLQGALRPDQVIAARSIPGLPGSVALPGHTDHIAIAFEPTPAASRTLGRATAVLLGAGGWTGVSLPGLGGLSAPDPADVPAIVRAAIDGAQSIAGLPYVWGGGHAGWLSDGYDCSGSVSYVLHAAGLLDSPLVSGDLMRYGLAGPGRWITIYANPSHTFMRIGDTFYGTSGFAHPGSTGPGWFSVTPPPGYLAGFVVRHPAGL